MFKIAGTTVHEPARGGVQIVDEPIWSSKTGRNTSGTMIGDIIGWKRTVSVTWPPLPLTDSQAIRKLIRDNSPFFSITFSDVEPGTAWPTSSGKPRIDQTVTMTVYCANIPRVISSLTNAYSRHEGVTIQFIEQ